MKSTIYKFDYKTGLLDNKLFLVRDYFQYYTTGVEQIIRQSPSAFGITQRNNNERPEQIMYDMFKDENQSDTFVAINNQNYLWATPFDLDAFQDAVDIKMHYVEFLMKDRVIDDPHQWDIMDDRVRADLQSEDDVARQIVIPAHGKMQLVNRKIRKYFEQRVVRG
ncbi:MAG: hypothetical protein J7L15_02180 [Clostridiales bacterium]|nr:hypothetical protein [Clostridiales bacterium]